MPEAAVVPIAGGNPPVDYAVAVWLGTPQEEIERGLREGWIRRPGVDLRAWTEERADAAIASPPAPGETADPDSSESTLLGSRERIEALLRRLDPGLEASTFADAWNEAGTDEVTRSRRFVDFLSRTLNVRQDEASDASSQLSALEQTTEGVRATARFVRLDGMTGRELERLAATEGGVRRALAEHSSWAFTGDRELVRLGDAAGRYDRFDPDSGEQLLSDAWLGDRARHAAWRSAAATGQPLEVAGDSWRFVDRAAGDAVSIQLEGKAGRPVHQVIFARDDGDRVTGDAGTDRIHGGRGDDILRGRAGDDLLEGDAGHDALHGGSGHDIVAGQQGDDELDGGAGDDRVEGGSGNDELSGGRGDDLLRGGTGMDSYRFERGDGADTIEDDGGIVIVDDVPIAGTMHREGEGWISADGRFHFMLESEGAGGSTLVIRESAAAAGGSEQATVRIAAWTSGSFGISLADADESDSGEDDSDPETNEGGRDEDEESARETGTASNDASSGARAALAQPPTPSNAPLLPPDLFEALPLVDTLTVAQALDEWSLPAPPDVGTAVQSTIGVTSADLGDALSEAAGDAESDGGTGSLVLDRWFEPSQPRLDDGGLKAPPDLVLRRMS
jgi:RTX calcium-binding nonapeptide repeat (4 copies)